MNFLHTVLSNPLVYVIFAFIVVVLHSIGRFLLDRKSLYIKEEQMISNLQIKPEDFDLLDIFIAKEFESYIIFNLGFKENGYIKNDDETKIVSELSAIVKYKISYPLLRKIGLIYHMDEDNMRELIIERCRLRVMSYVIEQNRIKKEE